MQKNSITLNDPQGVAAGQISTFDLPIGYTYHQLILEKTGGAAWSEIEDIRLKINGNTVQEWGGASDVDTINQFDKMGSASSIGALVLRLDRAGMRKIGDQHVTVLGTGARVDNGAPQAVRVTLDVKLASGSTITDLEGRALVSRPQPTGVIKFLRRVSFNTYTGAGEAQIASEIPRGGVTTSKINRIFIKRTSGAGSLTKVKMHIDNVEIFNRSAVANDAFQTNGERTPQSNWFVIDPSEEGLGRHAIDVANVNDFRLFLTRDGDHKPEVIIEYLGTL